LIDSSVVALVYVRFVSLVVYCCKYRWNVWSDCAISVAF